MGNIGVVALTRHVTFGLAGIALVAFSCFNTQSLLDRLSSFPLSRQDHWSEPVAVALCYVALTVGAKLLQVHSQIRHIYDLPIDTRMLQALFKALLHALYGGVAVQTLRAVISVLVLPAMMCSLDDPIRMTNRLLFWARALDLLVSAYLRPPPALPRSSHPTLDAMLRPTRRQQIMAFVQLHVLPVFELLCFWLSRNNVFLAVVALPLCCAFTMVGLINFLDGFDLQKAKRKTMKLHSRFPSRGVLVTRSLAVAVALLFTSRLFDLLPMECTRFTVAVFSQILLLALHIGVKGNHQPSLPGKFTWPSAAAAAGHSAGAGSSAAGAGDEGGSAAGGLVRRAPVAAAVTELN